MHTGVHHTTIKQFAHGIHMITIRPWYYNVQHNLALWKGVLEPSQQGT